MGLVPLIYSSIVLSQAAQQTVTPKVISVSMFKNGYAFVTREIPLTNGQAKVVEVPQTSLGSLWFWANEGQIDSVTSLDESKPTSIKVPFEKTQDVLTANIGKKFSFTLASTEIKDDHKSDKKLVVEGVLKNFSNNFVALETADGTIMFAYDKVESVMAKDPNVVLSRDQKGEETARFYQIKTKNNAKSVMMMSLERGMTWAPGYAIDLSSTDKLIFTAKSTVLNDLLDFEGAKVRLITGFPNLQFQNVLDPLTSRMSVDDWLGSISAGANRNANGYAFGGMGGGGGFANTRAGEITRKGAAGPATDMAKISFDPTDNSLITQNAAGEQLEDLYFYDLDNVSLKRGSRSYQYLYQFEAPYKRIYSWDGEAGTPIFNKIKFKNATGKPISTAAATMFKKGEVVGQGMMNYTAANTEAELVVGRSLDFRTDSSVDVVDRAVGAMKDKKGVATMDLVTYECEMEIENPKDEVVNFTLRKVVNGEITKTEPKTELDVSKTGVRGSNPISIAKWDLKLEANKTTKVVIRYKVYVPTGQ